MKLAKHVKKLLSKCPGIKRRNESSCNCSNSAVPGISFHQNSIENITVAAIFTAPKKKEQQQTNGHGQDKRWENSKHVKRHFH